MDLLNEAPAAFAGPELQELIDELPEEPIVPAGSSGTLPDRVTTLSSPGGGSEEQKGETATATSKRPTLQNQNQQQTALTLRTNNAMQQQQPKQGWTTRHANARRRSMPSDTLTWFVFGRFLFFHSSEFLLLLVLVQSETKQQKH